MLNEIKRTENFFNKNIFIYFYKQTFRFESKNWKVIKLDTSHFLKPLKLKKSLLKDIRR